MIHTPTVFILGAGASAAVGYPIGQELIDDICRKFEQRNPFFDKALEAGFSENLIAEFRHRLFASQLTTIDSFLALEPDFRGIGRFAIAAELISYEHEAQLLSRGRNSWYRKLRHALGSGLNELRENRIKFVTFN